MQGSRYLQEQVVSVLSWKHFSCADNLFLMHMFSGSLLPPAAFMITMMCDRCEPTQPKRRCRRRQCCI
jgi:hypothetical protein